MIAGIDILLSTVLLLDVNEDLEASLTMPAIIPRATALETMKHDATNDHSGYG